MNHKIIPVPAFVGQVARIDESQHSHMISYAIGVNASGEGDETALIFGPDGEEKYYILNGKHIDEYAKRDKEEQVKYFLDNLDQIGFWSNDPDDLIKSE